jgi:hypothetical protein
MNWLKLWRQNTSVHHRPDGSERRTAPRFPIRQAVTVRFTASGQYEFTGVSRDLSSSGIFLHTESQLEVGDQVEVILTLPSDLSDPIPVQVRGKVVRIEKSTSIGVAIAFESLVILPDALK